MIGDLDKAQHKGQHRAGGYVPTGNSTGIDLALGRLAIETA